MTGLTDMGSGQKPDLTDAGGVVDQSRQAWEASMSQQLDRLRSDLASRAPLETAGRCGASPTPDGLHLHFWGRPVSILWDRLEAVDETGSPLSTFDQAVLLYYLHAADGAPLSGHWIGFRELPNGTFYNQAFQGYSGDRLGRAFHEQPEAFRAACLGLSGQPRPELGEYAFAFQPLPRIALAAVLWPGDEDFPSRGQVLFDAASSHYMITDGLALLGSGLARRLERQKR